MSADTPYSATGWHSFRIPAMTEKDLFKLLNSIPKKQWVEAEYLETLGLDIFAIRNLVKEGMLDVREMRRQGCTTQSPIYNVYRLSVNGEIWIQDNREQRRYNRGMWAMTAALLVLTALLTFPTVRDIVWDVLSGICHSL